ncbi:hypothetical protein ACFL08_02180 [Patescibacteria group bacterium]
MRKTGLSVTSYLLILAACISVALLHEWYGPSNLNVSIKEIAQKELIGADLTKRDVNIITKNKEEYEVYKHRILKKVAKKIVSKRNLDGREIAIYLRNSEGIDETNKKELENQK